MPFSPYLVLIADRDMNTYTKYIRNRFKFLSHAPVLFVSAKLKQGIEKIMPQVNQVYRERMKRLPTSAVNSIIREAVTAHVLPRVGGRQLKVLYATQAEINPPTFVFFVNDPKLVHFSYRRYLENRLRKAFGFDGSPFRLIFKTRGES